MYLYCSNDYTYILYHSILLVFTEFWKQWKQFFIWERLKPTNFQWHLPGRAIFSFTLSWEYLLYFHLSTKHWPPILIQISAFAVSVQISLTHTVSCSHRKETKMHTTEKQNKQKTSPQEKATRTPDKIFSHESQKDNRHLLTCLLSSLKALKLIHGFITTIK